MTTRRGPGSLGPPLASGGPKRLLWPAVCSEVRLRACSSELAARLQGARRERGLGAPVAAGAGVADAPSEDLPAPVVDVEPLGEVAAAPALGAHHDGPVLAGAHAQRDVGRGLLPVEADLVRGVGADGRAEGGLRGCHVAWEPFRGEEVALLAADQRLGGHLVQRPLVRAEVEEAGAGRGLDVLERVGGGHVHLLVAVLDVREGEACGNQPVLRALVADAVDAGAAVRGAHANAVLTIGATPGVARAQHAVAARVGVAAQVEVLSEVHGRTRLGDVVSAQVDCTRLASVRSRAAVLCTAEEEACGKQHRSASRGRCRSCARRSSRPRLRRGIRRAAAS
mmetsp:Transcript_74815/g.167653  ORF Transcript_74815/g.167653 Transcript_74815/m.167653 type:complete len:338 (-) Transcript_74815:135-1148(-)